MNHLGYNKAFAYALPSDRNELERIMLELIQKGYANLGPAMTNDNVIYFRDYKTTVKYPILFQMVGQPHFVSIDGSLLPEPSLDATTYYYDNISWSPNNNDRKAYIKAIGEYISDTGSLAATSPITNDTIDAVECFAQHCINNTIFCCQCIEETIVPIISKSTKNKGQEAEKAEKSQSFCN